MGYFSLMWTILCLEGFLIPFIFCEQDAKPEFVKRSKTHYTTKFGKVTRMKCEIVNSTGVNISWIRNGSRIIGKATKPRRGRFAVKNTRRYSILKIKNIKMKDAGEYICEAVNKFGLSSRKLNLNVLKDTKPQFLKRSKTRYTAEYGKVTRLKCELVKSTGVTISWIRNGAIIGKTTNARGHFAVRTTRRYSILKIKNTKMTDAGKYVCEAVNKFGSSSRKLNLRVLKGKKGTCTRINTPCGIRGTGKPWFIRPFAAPIQFLAWPALADIKLKCKADGEHPISYRWFKNGKSVTYRRLDPKISTTRWYLRIKTAVPSDNGLYTCVVSNRLGNISRSVKFTVLEKAQTRPILSIGYPKNKTVKSGSNVSFECRELVSQVLTDYRWLKWNKLPKYYPRLQFGNILTEHNSSDYQLINSKQYLAFKVRDINHQQLYGGRVILQNVSKEDAGLYTCIVSNYVGSSSRSAFLIIDDKE